MKQATKRKIRAASFAAAAALAAANAGAQDAPGKNGEENGSTIETHGRAFARAGAHVANYTHDQDYVPVYIPHPGVFTGAALSLKKSFLTAGVFAAGMEKLRLAPYSAQPGRYVIGGGFVQAEDPVPGIAQLKLYGYARKQVDAALPPLRDFGADLRTQDIKAGDYELKLRAGLRYGPEDSSLDPAMAYGLLGVENGALKLYAGVFAPLYDTPQSLVEMDLRLSAATRAEVQCFTDLADDGGKGPYHARARVTLSHDFSKSVSARASALVSGKGLEEGLLRTGFGESAPGAFAAITSGAARHPGTGRLLPTGRIEAGWKF